jgi:sentrin-specific protease 1
MWATHCTPLHRCVPSCVPQVINCYVELLKQREIADLTLPRCLFCSTLFYPKLVEVRPCVPMSFARRVCSIRLCFCPLRPQSNKGYCFSNVANWTKGVDVFAKDLVVVPIHRDGNHWTLAIINLRQMRFEYIDSMRGGAGKVLQHLRCWLLDLSLAKGQPIDLTIWEDVVYKEGTPQQVGNGTDCGVFVCTNANCISRNAHLTFTQADIPYLRRYTEHVRTDPERAPS